MAIFNDRMGRNGCLVVDRGMVSAGNVKDIVDKRNLDLVGGMRMTDKMKGVVGPITDYDVEFKIKEETILAEELKYDVGGKLRRCILYFSEQKADRDLKAREKNVRLVEEELSKTVDKYQKQGGRGRKPNPKKTIKELDELVSRRNVKGFFEYRFVGGRGGRRFKWSRDNAALEEAKDLDGKYVLITTLSDSPMEILKIYRSRVVVERAFRLTKERIKIRPIWSREGGAYQGSSVHLLSGVSVDEPHRTEAQEGWGYDLRPESHQAHEQSDERGGQRN
jgi:transposase